MSNFAIDISRFTDKVRGREDIIVRKIAQDVTNGVILMTPVDTGRARANWNAGINNINPMVSENQRLTAIERAKAIITRIVAGDKFYVTNNVDYIEFLEDGSSQQAPQGMVKVTLRNYPGIVERGVNQAKRERP